MNEIQGDSWWQNGDTARPSIQRTDPSRPLFFLFVLVLLR